MIITVSMSTLRKVNAETVIRDANNLPECKNLEELMSAIIQIFRNNLIPPHTMDEIMDTSDDMFYKLLIAIMHRCVRKYPNREIQDFLLPNAHLDVIGSYFM